MIVYVHTKDVAWKVYHFLQGASATQCYVGMYHASLTQHTKSSIYCEFRSTTSSLRCLVATVAFGMVRYTLFFGYYYVHVGLQIFVVTY